MVTVRVGLKKDKGKIKGNNMCGELIRINPDAGKKKYSIVHWQTGLVDKFGEYLVTLKNGTVQVAEFDFEVDALYNDEYVWRGCNKDDIVAWCKLDDIKPYRE